MKFVFPAIAWLMLVVMTLKVLSAPTIYINFKIQQDYIASVLCVNKDKPELQCNGQCSLLKQMNANEEAQDTGVNENRLLLEHLPQVSTFVFLAEMVPPTKNAFVFYGTYSVYPNIFTPPPLA